MDELSTVTPTPRERAARLVLPDGDALVVAGSSGTERLPPSRATPSPLWFQPEHVRDRGPATERLQAAAEAGADVLVAPAYRTHRRALMSVGESRRAAEWTRAAVEVARVAAERAAERSAATRVPEHGSDPDTGDAPPMAPSSALIPALVAGPMGPLEPDRSEGASEPGGTADEDHERAELLADAGADLLLIEGSRSIAAARSAIEAATATGLPVWVGFAITASGRHLPSGETLQEAWQELAPLGAGPVALSPRSLPQARDVLDLAGRVVDRKLALWLTPDEPLTGEQVAGWLGSGARAVGLAAGAVPDRIGLLRRAVDVRVTASAQQRAEVDAAWHAAVADAARRAPGGRAAWLGAEPDTLAGFDWVAVSIAEGPRLPAAAFRLVVVDAAGEDPGTPMDHLLHPGGYLVLRSRTRPGPMPGGVSLQRSEPLPDAWLTLARRDR